MSYELNFNATHITTTCLLDPRTAGYAIWRAANTQTAVYSCMISSYNSVSQVNFYAAAAETSGNPRFDVGSNSQRLNLGSSYLDPDNGTEYQWRVEWDGNGGNFRVYRDGVLAGTYTNYSAPGAPTQPVVFGRPGSFGAQYFEGKLKDVQLYTGVYPSGTLINHWPIDDNVANGGEITDVVGGAHGVLTLGSGSWTFTGSILAPRSWGQIIY